MCCEQEQVSCWSFDNRASCGDRPQSPSPTPIRSFGLTLHSTGSPLDIYLSPRLTENMLALLRSARSPRALLQTSRVGAYARHFASEVDSTPRDTATSTPAAPLSELQPEPEELESPDDKPLRPPHGVTIDPDHGLNAFFRAFQQPDGRWERLSAQPKSEDGNTGMFCAQGFWLGCILTAHGLFKVARGARRNCDAKVLKTCTPYGTFSCENVTYSLRKKKS